MDNKKPIDLVKVLCVSMKNDSCLQKMLHNAESEEEIYNVGAILADAILQRSTKYTVVRKKVDKVNGWRYDSIEHVRNNKRRFNDFFRGKGEFAGKGKARFPEQSVQILSNLLDRIGDKKSIEDLKWWLSNSDRRSKLTEIKYVGPKTADYLYQLCGGDVICVDVRIQRYVERKFKEIKKKRGISINSPKNYYRMQKLLESVAGKLGVSCRDLDRAIWGMEDKEAEKQQKKGKKP